MKLTKRKNQTTTIAGIKEGELRFIAFALEHLANRYEMEATTTEHAMDRSIKLDRMEMAGGLRSAMLYMADDRHDSGTLELTPKFTPIAREVP